MLGSSTLCGIPIMYRRSAAATLGEFAKMPDQRSTPPRASSTSRLPLPPELVTPPRPPLAPRYSLRSLLILMTVVAVGVVLAGVYEGFFLALVTVAVVFGGAIVCVTAAVYCRGRAQTFFIGAACVTCFQAMSSPPVARTWGTLLILAPGQVIAIVTAGGIAVFTRRFIEKRGWNLPPSSPHDNNGS
jgi:hypothetical protein